MNNAPGQDLKPNRDSVAIFGPSQAPVPPGNVTLRFSAKAKGDWSNSLAVRVRPVLGATLSLLPDTVHGGSAYSGSVASATTTFMITIARTDKLANGDQVIINSKSYPVANVNAAAETTTFNVVANVSDATSVAEQQHAHRQERRIILDHEQVDRPLGYPARREGHGEPRAPGCDRDPRPHPGPDLCDRQPFRRQNVIRRHARPDLLRVLARPSGDPEHAQGGVTQVAQPNDTIDVKNASQLYVNALVEFDNGGQKEFANVVAVNDVSVTFSKSLANTYYEGQKIRVLEAEVGVRKYADDGVTVVTEETFSNLRLSYEAGHELPGQ